MPMTFYEKEHSSAEPKGLPFHPFKDDGQDRVVEILRLKHEEYTRSANTYFWMYYCTRLVAALGAGLIPFVVTSSPRIATTLSIIVVLATTIDLVFSPKDKLQLYSKAVDLLTIAGIKSSGKYELYKDALEILVTTNRESLERLSDLENVIKKVQETTTTKS